MKGLGNPVNTVIYRISYEDKDIQEKLTQTME